MHVKQVSSGGFDMALPAVTVNSSWDQVFLGLAGGELESCLPGFLQQSRWFGGKAREIKAVSLEQTVPVAGDALQAVIAFLRVEYGQGSGELYLLPLGYATGAEEARILEEHPAAVVLRLTIREKGEGGLLFDALVRPAFGEFLFRSIELQRQLKADGAQIISRSAPMLRHLRTSSGPLAEPRVLTVEQSNTSIAYGQQFILKVMRRLEGGINPELEIGLFLTEKGFEHVPAVAGSLEYVPSRGEPATLAILELFIPNEGDAWSYTVSALGRYYDRIMARHHSVGPAPAPGRSITELVDRPLPPEWLDMAGDSVESAHLLGRRTAELHVALASATEDPRFSPEPFSILYQRSLNRSMRNLTKTVYRTLRRKRRDVEEKAGAEALMVFDMEDDILELFQKILKTKLAGQRIRCHGDLHLGQVLYTGTDFVIIDFEGEPAQSIGERKIKHSPLKDVAGMLRSFNYAAYSVLFEQRDGGLICSEEIDVYRRGTDVWTACVSALFLRAYLAVAASGHFLPETMDQVQLLLDLYLLEKAIYELGYELNHRPDWIVIPLEGIRRLLERED